MKFPSAAFLVCSLAALATAAPPEEKPKSLFQKISSVFELETILTSRPIAALFAKGGIDINERFAEAKRQVSETGWDERIPVITDQNYRELIVEEQLSLDEREERVWFLLITIPNADPVTKFVDEKYEAAFNLTHPDGEYRLPHVRWGRINYMEVTEITTRWWIWKAPLLVVLRKGGQELRFYSPQQVRLEPEVIYKFLNTEGWKQTPVWSGALAPGGALEPYMDSVARWFTKSYDFFRTVPRWLMLLGTGMLGSFLIGLMHASSAPAAAKPIPRVNKHARIATDAKEHDGGSAVQPTQSPPTATATATAVKPAAAAVAATNPHLTRSRSSSPAKTGSPKRASARLLSKK